MIDESYECDPSREKLCIMGKDYVRDLVDDGVISRVTAEGNNVGLFSVLSKYLEKERAKLENIVRIFSRDDNSTQEEELLISSFNSNL